MNASFLAFVVATTSTPPAGCTAGRAAERYERDPTDDNLRRLAVASPPWYFPPEAVEQGRNLLSRMPYNRSAVGWSDEHFDHTYVARWWPQSLPTLVVSGGRGPDRRPEPVGRPLLPGRQTSGVSSSRTAHTSRGANGPGRVALAFRWYACALAGRPRVERSSTARCALRALPASHTAPTARREQVERRSGIHEGFHDGARAPRRVRGRNVD